MGLFNFFKKSPSKNAKSSKQNFSIEMHGYVNGVEVPLPEDEGVDDDSISFATYNTIKVLISPKESEMVQLASALGKGMDTDTQIAVLSELIAKFYDLKDYCATLGKDYADYFSKTWEHGRNSRCSDFCYITRYEEQLAQLRENYESLKAKDERYLQNIKDLKPRVIACIRENPGILQTELYKQFDETVKPDIQEMLYFLSKDGFIIRQKKGNTYELHLK